MRRINTPSGQFEPGDPTIRKPGTILPAWFMNQLQEELAAVIEGAGIVLDEADHGQVLTAIRALVGRGAVPFYATVPPTRKEDFIFVAALQAVMSWRTIGTFTGYASLRVGAIEAGWTSSPLPWQVAAIGSTINKSAYPALYARFAASGLLVSSATWRSGEYKICDVGTAQFRLPDLRNVFMRFYGADVDTNGQRALGSWQTDAFENHVHGSSLRTGTAITQKGEVLTKDIAPAGTGGDGGYYDETGAHGGAVGAGFKAVPTGYVLSARVAVETRPVNVAFIPYIHI